MSRLWIILVIIGALAFWGVQNYNAITVRNQAANAAWAQVQNEYQRRADLVPNLVNTVKGAANFEKQTLTDVIEARASATKITLSPEMLNDPQAMQRFEQAQGALTSSLSRLMAVAENYPDLKANQDFLTLQSQLEGTENRITIARKDYIDAVQGYNTTITLFPGVLWAHLFGFTPKQSFAASEDPQKAPVVQF